MTVYLYVQLVDHSAFPMADFEEIAHIEHHCSFESQRKNTPNNGALTDEQSIHQAESWNIERLSVYLYLPLVHYGLFHIMDLEEIAHKRHDHRFQTQTKSTTYN